MIIIAFSNKTSLCLPRVICRKLKHAAPIVPDGTELVMDQFVRRGYVKKIRLRFRDIKILNAHGWKFVYVDGATISSDFNYDNAWSCVDLSKRALNIQNWRIQTPLALYKLCKK